MPVNSYSTCGHCCLYHSVVGWGFFCLFCSLLKSCIPLKRQIFSACNQALEIGNNITVTSLIAQAYQHRTLYLLQIICSVVMMRITFMISFNANMIKTDGDITKKLLSERLIFFLTRKPHQPRAVILTPNLAPIVGEIAKWHIDLQPLITFQLNASFSINSCITFSYQLLSIGILIFAFCNLIYCLSNLTSIHLD